LFTLFFFVPAVASVNYYTNQQHIKRHIKYVNQINQSEF